MKIGSKYRVKEIEARHWQQCAKQLRLKTNDFMEMFEALAKQLPQACVATSAKLQSQGLTHEVVESLAQSITERSETVIKQYFPSCGP